MSVADIKARFRATADTLAQLESVRKRGVADNVANRPHAAIVKRGSNREEMSQRAFVRAFGDKVKRYRLSARADFIGLMVLGFNQGIMVTGEADGSHRKLRIVDVLDSGHISVTKRYITLRDNESVSNLQRGLLRWVR